MTASAFAAIVLAAGKGTRMKSARPKVLHPVANRPMIRHVLDAVATLGPARTVVVVAPGMEAVAAAASPASVAIQEEQLGTGHAVMAARPALEGAAIDEILILCGDTPLLTGESLGRLLAERRRRKAGIAVLGMRPPEPGVYGRMIERDGMLEAIVEAKDAAPEVLAVPLCNAGVFAAEATLLWRLLARVDRRNAQGEYYLTDIVGLARGEGVPVVAVEAPHEETAGINSRAELAAAEAAMQQRLRARHMAAGVTLTAPETVFFSADTVLGRDVTIGPFTVFGPGCVVEDGVEILGFCHFTGAVIRVGAIVGPYSRLRPGAEIGEDAHVGNFVEVKASRLGKGAKANHHSYIGDTEIGAKANIGAGTITVNYNGFTKEKTVIGEGAFIGSNSSLVAPVTVGAGAIVGAGSVITRDVAADALALERAPQVEKPGAARAFREKRAAAKAARAKK
ncbi:MAG: bifunctional UDP-N-acetylglucosamine diphosphorylase/glucosamine-1-phosphate N-acetyltransferase GlmU [Rhodospirillales bacterium]|nr:bifunctional UDP-N-acetylglucosamine diphosphorylase/glucosamine-1-phosphate N-acetyltransferase GlmU [Rhodospirillales bacterium]